MKPFRLIGAVSAAALMGLLPITAWSQEPNDSKYLERARQLDQRILTFDTHLDLPFDYPGAAVDGTTQFDLPKTARGQLKGAALAVFVPQGPRTPEGYAKARADAEKK